MAITNRDRVGRALDLLRDGLAPFVEREFTNVYGGSAREEAKRFVQDDRLNLDLPFPEWDVAPLLRLMWEAWNDVFRRTLGHAERSLVSELRDVRNRWAHQRPFSTDDAYRAIDSAIRLLTAVSAPQVEDLEKARMELLRVRFEEQARNERRKNAGAVESQVTGTLKPWREVVEPHPDVASGRYQQAEFAADLWQVHLGQGSAEYRDPVEFYRRTYLTESLRRLLVGAIQRLTGKGGDPVVQLQTNFGGGKTHSMLALYHLFSGTPPTELVGIEAVLQEAGVESLPAVRRVVLVGNKISPGNPVTKPDGTVVRTLWGELAWQLGGKEAYERIRADDERATNPGDALRELFDAYGPCLILIDEWVAYARQLHDEDDLPGGSFETQFSFAQALTESAKLSKHCLLVISLPASDTANAGGTSVDDVEVGGQRGREALARLRNVIGRVETSWRPATAEESFEIVRRRLFQPMVDPKQFVDRDNVARAFYELYRNQSQEFPPECRDPEYEKRIRAAYPIHPEVFERLYNDWGTLVTFHRTRGVLRLMAAVIHSLWERGDRNPLILPSTIPMDDDRVRFELTRYLSDNWTPIIEKDVDGPDSLPQRLDNEVPNLGRYAAARRVARTIYLGSAPTTGMANRGLEDRRIYLGCVMPGEPPNVFGDALRRLTAQATHLYHDGTRYWYDTQPTVTKLAEDRAEQLKRDRDAIFREIDRRLRKDLVKTGDFPRVHPLPVSGQDVADDVDTRLVVLGPDHLYGREADSPALVAAKAILESRGNAPRRFRNTLVFLAADRTRYQDLEAAVCSYLAWDSIVAEKEELNLTPFQVRQAEMQRQAADTAVTARIPETYQWLLVPVQQTPQSPIEWQAIRLSGQDALAVRASKKLRQDELLVTALGPTRLRMELDRVPLWRGDHVSIRQLVEDFASYPYLPRLQSPEVLTRAIQDGLGLLTWEQDTFAYAESYDEQQGRYRGLRAGQHVTVGVDDLGLLVKPEVARAQLEAEKPVGVTAPGGGMPDGGTPLGAGGAAGVAAVEPRQAGQQPTSRRPTRYHGSVSLDPTRVGRDAGRIAEEVIAHLASLVGARVRVTLEIEAEIPDGVPENVVRVVTENSRTLKFESHGFEDE
nr:MAG: AAA+ family ATPase [bacterium]